MNIEEKEFVYNLLNEQFNFLSECLNSCAYEMQKIDHGENFKEWEVKPKVFMGGISTHEEYENEWKNLKLRQNEILKAMFHKDMLSMFFKDHATWERTVMNRLF